MAGFLLTGGGAGCPPTQAPPAGYENPFRFNDAGFLWLNGCFPGLRYFGAARHDIAASGVLGSGSYPVDSGVLSAPVTAGTYTNLTVTNDTDCTLGILLGYDMFVDIQARADNLVRWVVAASWNGVVHSQNALSSTRLNGSTALIRTQATSGANPHDLGLESGGVATMTLAPGASGLVGCQLFLQYKLGASTGTESVFESYSAVRAYGYVLV